MSTCRLAVLAFPPSEYQRSTTGAQTKTPWRVRPGRSWSRCYLSSGRP